MTCDVWWAASLNLLLGLFACYVLCSFHAFLVVTPQKLAGYGDHPAPVTVQRVTTAWTALSTLCCICGAC